MLAHFRIGSDGDEDCTIDTSLHRHGPGYKFYTASEHSRSQLGRRLLRSRGGTRFANICQNIEVNRPSYVRGLALLLHLCVADSPLTQEPLNFSCHNIAAHLTPKRWQVCFKLDQ